MRIFDYVCSVCGCATEEQSNRESPQMIRFLHCFMCDDTTRHNILIPCDDVYKEHLQRKNLPENTHQTTL